MAAHALPLLLGPALTRTYSPEAFGQFALLWALATNVAVVACARYGSPDLAQQAFLAAGGPDRDRRGLDPDGDGFACAWDPRPFRLQ